MHMGEEIYGGLKWCVERLCYRSGEVIYGSGEVICVKTWLRSSLRSP